MSSKMRETLEEMADRCNRSHSVWDNWRELTISEIAHRYGPLEFTREEVQKIGYRILEAAANRSEFYPGLSLSEMIEQIVSHHTEAEGRCCCSCEEPEHSRESYGEKCLKCGKHRPPNGKVNFVDDTPTIKASEIEQRLAAIEKRLLADGHSEFCRKGFSSLMQESAPCNCGRDEIRENAK